MEWTLIARGDVFNKTWLPVILQKSETILEEQGVNVVDWPGNSPDRKLIQSSWRIFKTKRVGNDCTTLTKTMELLLPYGSVMNIAQAAKNLWN